MSRATALAGLLPALLLLAGASRAQEDAPAPAPPDYGRDGAFVAVAFAYHTPLFENHVDNRIETKSVTTPTVACGTCNFVSHLDPSLGIDARLGYRFLRHFALEAEVEWIAEYDVELFETTSGGGGSQRTGIKGVGGSANLRLYPFTGWLQPYVELGLGYQRLERTQKKRITVGATTFQTRVDVSDGDVVGRFGGGFDFYVDPRWGVNLGAAYVAPGGSLEKYEAVSSHAGFFYRF